jgi:hypothetical protein
MKNRGKRVSQWVTIVGVLVLIGSMSWSVYAVEERAPGISSGFSFGAAKLVADEFGPGFSGQVFLEYAPFIHEIAVRLTGGYLFFGENREIGQRPFNSTEYVTFEDAYGTLGVVYRFSRARLVPYATANVGIYHYTKEDVYPAAGPIIGGVQVSPYDVTRETSGNDFGFNLGGGLEYFTSARTSMSIDVLLHSIHGDINKRVMDVNLMFRFFPSL